MDQVVLSGQIFASLPLYLFFCAGAHNNTNLQPSNAGQVDFLPTLEFFPVLDASSEDGEPGSLMENLISWLYSTRLDCLSAEIQRLRKWVESNAQLEDI